jgi:hypothetical protein
MREKYDFSNGKRGKFYRADMKLNIPIYFITILCLLHPSHPAGEALRWR